MNDTMCGLVKEVNGPGDLVYHTDLPVPQVGDDLPEGDHLEVDRLVHVAEGAAVIAAP